VGIEYQGFENQPNSHNTIEAHLFSALKKTMLIKEIDTAFLLFIIILETKF
jgi:tRNA U38,U39,U40 pseudouridine synthase TruA